MITTDIDNAIEDIKRQNFVPSCVRLGRQQMRELKEISRDLLKVDSHMPRNREGRYAGLPIFEASHESIILVECA